MINLFNSVIFDHISIPCIFLFQIWNSKGCCSKIMVKDITVNPVLPTISEQQPPVKNGQPNPCQTKFKYQFLLKNLKRSYVQQPLIRSPKGGCCKQVRGRSFDRITFFRNSSVVLMNCILVEKWLSFEWRGICSFLSNVVLSNFKRTVFEGKNKTLSRPSHLCRLG